METHYRRCNGGTVVMDLEQTKALKNFFHRGYIVILNGEKVIDMCEIEPENMQEEDALNVNDLGYYTIETDGYIYSTRVISISDVEVLLPIDWYNILGDQYHMDAELYNAVRPGPGAKGITDYVEDLKNAYDEAGD